MQQKLGQTDFEDLSAYLDGQLDADRKGTVEELIRSDPTWEAECNQLQALDKILDVCDVPAPPNGLAERILERVRTKTARGKVLRWVWPLAGAAAAAAIIVVATILNGPAKPKDIAKSPVVPEDGVEQAIIEHFDFVRDLNVLENYETLEAIERIELASRGR